MMFDRQKPPAHFPVFPADNTTIEEILRAELFPGPQHPIAYEDTLGLLDRVVAAYDRIGYRLNWMVWPRQWPGDRASGLYAIPKNEPGDVGTRIDFTHSHLLTTDPTDIERLLLGLSGVPLLDPTGTRELVGPSGISHSRGIDQPEDPDWGATFDANARESMNLISLYYEAVDRHRSGLTSRHYGATILDTGAHQPVFTGADSTLECYLCCQPWPCNAAKSLMDVVRRRIGGADITQSLRSV